MTHLIPTVRELYERIDLTIQDRPCLIEYRKVPWFASFQDGTPIGIIGVAVAMVGIDCQSPEFIHRHWRADQLDWEWSYLMHFEQAITALFHGDIWTYNHTGLFPKLPFIGHLDESNYHKILNVCG